jgi:hypothetical protein
MTPVYLGVILLSKFRSVEFMMSFLTLATLSVCFYQARNLRARLYDGPELRIFRYYPLSDEAVFRQQCQTFLRNSLWWILNFGALDGLLAVRAGVRIRSSVLAGIAFGIVQWLFLVATAVCLAAFVRRQIFNTLALIFGASAIGLFALASAQPQFVIWLSQLSYIVPPLAWVFYGMGITPGGSAFYELWPSVSAAVLLALVPAAYRRLQREYASEPSNAAAPAPAPDVPDLSPAELREGVAQTQNAAASAIYERAFLTGFDWSKSGPLERFIAFWLNARDRLVLEFLVAANPPWTGGLRRLAFLIVFVTVAFFMLANASSGVTGFVAVVAALLALANLFGRWRGLATVLGAGLQSPFYAVYPVSFSEMLKVMVIVNVVRYGSCIPLLAVAATVLGLKGKWDAAAAIEMGLKVVLLGFLVQPVLPIIFFSSGTNDTQKASAMLTAAGLIIALVGCGAAFVISHSLVVIVLSGLGFALVSLLGLVLYGWMFSHSRFDLVPARLTKSTE